MTPIVDCPICARKLRIPDDLLGDVVRCPTCGGAFAAPAGLLPSLSRLAADAPTPMETVAPLEIAPRQVIPRVPTLRPMLVSEERGKPPAEKSQPAAPPDETRPCVGCGEQFPIRTRRCPACGEFLGDREEVPWPCRDCESHRAGLVLGLGIASVLLAATCLLSVFGLPAGVAAWMIGQRDLERMRAGAMDPEGKNTTHAGWICGIAGTVLNALLLLYLALSAMAFLR